MKKANNEKSRTSSLAKALGVNLPSESQLKNVSTVHKGLSTCVIDLLNHKCDAVWSNDIFSAIKKTASVLHTYNPLKSKHRKNILF